MKVIDLLNKIANGEEVPNKIRIDHWCYEFEWVEHINNYYDESADVDLMSVLSMDKEELNYGVKIIEEDKQIEKIEISYAGDIEEKIFYEESDKPNHRILWDAGTELLINKINEIIDKVNELEKENE